MATENQNLDAGAQNQEGQADVRTFTQEEVNQIVQKRVARYADYEDLKEKAKKYDEYEEASKSELEREKDRADSLEKELNKLKDAEKVRAIRAAVSKETGVPAHLLTGTTEEDCKKQAADIKAYAAPSGYPKVQDAGESNGQPNKGTAKQQFIDFFGTM